jgi:TRAP-type C4-dicarboxylate transport system permease large subunit
LSDNTLTLPGVLPLVDETGFSLLWFGVVLVKLLEIGMVTPPMGMNVFVIKSVVGNLASLTQVFRGVFGLSSWICSSWPCLSRFPIS